jgi:hypothetical protein
MRHEECKIALINEFQNDLGEVSKLLQSGDVSEAEHWVFYLRRQYVAKVNAIIEGMYTGASHAK